MSEEERDIREDLEHAETKRLLLFYLYLYHKNYGDEDRETKREIREYYDERLRYKGAFYKDKKRFEKFGSPMDWTVYKVKSYSLKEDKQQTYFSGMTSFGTFIYPSSFLIELTLSKDVNYVLITRDTEGKYAIFEETFNSINNDIKDLVKKMNKIDTVSNTVRIKKGTADYKNISLDELRVIFKLTVNEYTRYISTKFVPRNLLNESSDNALFNYLEEITGLKQRELTDYNPSGEFDEPFILRNCVLDTVYVVKNTSQFNARYMKRSWGNYNFETEQLRSIMIMHVIA